MKSHSPSTVPRMSLADAHYDAVVVGAGPYGLSVSAHLLGRGLSVGVFGKTLEFWRQHMPKGMLLRSHWWATHLSDPSRRFGFDRFFESAPGHGPGYPVPIETFIKYGQWFQERAVPVVDETYVTSVARDGNGFLIALEDGRFVRTSAVIMAVGPRYYAKRPGWYSRVPSKFVTHSSDHNDLGAFRGRHVVVIGAGQSAIESAGLLHEAGARVHVVSRRPIVWLEHDRTDTRRLMERMLAPANGLAPGWINWMLEKRPYTFYRLTQHLKDRHNSHWAASAAAWLKDRVVDKTVLHEGQEIVSLNVRNDHVDVTLSNASMIRADHILLATGYGVDINRLTMLDPHLRADIQTHGNIPHLSHWFESSVRGLYFVGLTSMHAFGPLYRFVAGCPATARRVAESVARTAARRRRSVSTQVGCEGLR